MKRVIKEIKKIISTRDLVPKVICLLLSIILWTYVNSTKVGEVKFRIPVEFTSLPKNLTIFEGLNKYITVSLTGRKDILKNVNVKNINASIDVSKPQIGLRKMYPIKITKHGLPESIEINLSSKDILLTIDNEQSKRVKIEPNIQMSLKDGYILGNVKIDPPLVTINGPETSVSKIDKIRTGLISIGGQTGRIVREVFLDTGEFISIKTNVNVVKVVIPVLESTSLQKYDVKINIENSQEGFKYILSKQYTRVYLRSIEEDLELSEDDMNASVNLAGLNLKSIFEKNGREAIEREFKIDFTLQEEGVEIITLIPSKISVKIIKAK